MLKQNLTKDTVQIVDEVNDWEESVAIAVKPLINIKAVKLGYIDSILQNIKENGLYLIISPGLAFLHARPDENVKKNCFSFTLLKEAISFGHQKFDPVDLLFVFAAKDENAHREILRKLAELLAQEGFKDDLRRAESKEELLALLS